MKALLIGIACGLGSIIFTPWLIKLCGWLGERTNGPVGLWNRYCIWVSKL